MADPNLQIRVGGGGSSRPCHKGLGQSPKNCFRALEWSNNKGGAGPAVPLPWFRHCLCERNTETHEFSTSQKFVQYLVNIA